MNRKFIYLWAAALIGIALLNIFDFLPDWTTIAAVLSYPFVARLAGRNNGSHCAACGDQA